MTIRSIFGRSAVAFAATIAAQPLVAAPAPTATPVVVTGTATEHRVREVKYADLNLATQAGEKRLRQRVRSAVRAVCEDTADSGIQLLALSRCLTSARSGAEVQVARAVQRARATAASSGSSVAALTVSAASPN